MIALEVHTQYAETETPDPNCQAKDNHDTNYQERLDKLQRHLGTRYLEEALTIGKLWVLNLSN